MNEFNGWAFISEYYGDKINEVCGSNFGKTAGDPCEGCPLYTACVGFENDMSKTDAENTRAFEINMAKAYQSIEAKNA